MTYVCPVRKVRYESSNCELALASACARGASLISGGGVIVGLGWLLLLLLLNGYSKSSANVPALRHLLVHGAGPGTRRRSGVLVFLPAAVFGSDDAANGSGSASYPPCSAIRTSLSSWSSSSSSNIDDDGDDDGDENTSESLIVLGSLVGVLVEVMVILLLLLSNPAPVLLAMDAQDGLRNSGKSDLAERKMLSSAVVDGLYV